MYGIYGNIEVLKHMAFFLGMVLAATICLIILGDPRDGDDE